MTLAAQTLAPAASFRLDGRTALVTGAGRGLGRGIALALAQAGADVAVISRTEHELAQVSDTITALGRTCWTLPCDVCDTVALTEAIDDIPSPDILVACAGTNVPQAFLEVDETTFDRILDLNLRATFFTVQVAARRMVEHRTGGSIVLLSSQMGHVGAANRSVYCASKHAIEGLTRALAVELAPMGVRVNNVAPTYIHTPMTEAFFGDGEFRRRAEAAIPLGRIGEVGDVAGAVIYLCSPAAALVTGTSLVIDGGYTAQ